MANRRRPSPASLVRDITVAFEDVPYPGDDAIVHDRIGDQVERNAVRALYKGRSWQQIANDPEIRVSSGAVATLGFMTPEAFRYYIPAFMQLTVEHYNGTNIDPDSVAFYIGENAPHIDFSVRHWHAINNFLEFIRDLERFDRKRIEAAIEVVTRLSAVKKSAS